MYKKIQLWVLFVICLNRTSRAENGIPFQLSANSVCSSREGPTNVLLFINTFHSFPLQFRDAERKILLGLCAFSANFAEAIFTGDLRRCIEIPIFFDETHRPKHSTPNTPKAYGLASNFSKPCVCD